MGPLPPPPKRPPWDPKRCSQDNKAPQGASAPQTLQEFQAPGPAAPVLLREPLGSQTRPPGTPNAPSRSPLRSPHSHPGAQPQDPYPRPPLPPHFHPSPPFLPFTLISNPSPCSPPPFPPFHLLPYPTNPSLGAPNRPQAPNAISRVLPGPPTTLSRPNQPCSLPLPSPPQSCCCRRCSRG